MTYSIQYAPSQVSQVLVSNHTREKKVTKRHGKTKVPQRKPPNISCTGVRRLNMATTAFRFVESWWLCPPSLPCYCRVWLRFRRRQRMPTYAHALKWRIDEYASEPYLQMVRLVQRKCSDAKPVLRYPQSTPLPQNED